MIKCSDSGAAVTLFRKPQLKVGLYFVLPPYAQLVPLNFTLQVPCVKGT